MESLDSDNNFSGITTSTLEDIDDTKKSQELETPNKSNEGIKEENIDDSNNEILENTIKISVNDKDDSNDISVSEVKTVNMTPIDNDTMEHLDYNEKRIIEKDNIDYEKIERLEDIQDEIGSRVSRMLNKKRYKKKKSE